MTHSQPSISIQLAFVEADSAKPDPAHVGAEARDVTEALRRQGYDIAPASTGERGGALYDVVMTLSQTIHDNKDLLMTLLTTAAPIITYLVDKSKKNAEQAPAAPTAPSAPAAPATQPSEVVIKLGRAQVTVPVDHPIAADALLAQLLRDDADLMTAPPTGLTVQVQVPSRRQRRI